MSILNAWIEPGRALVAVDTLATSLEGKGSAEVSKVMLLPHRNLVAACRGSQQFLLEVFAGLYITAHESDIDGVERWLPAQLDQGLDAMAAAARARGVDSSHLSAVELLLVGWSAQRGRMIGLRYIRGADDAEFTGKVIDKWTISPGDHLRDPDGGWRPVPAISDDAAMEQLAREQVRSVRSCDPDAAIGGRLIVAEVTRDTVSVRTVCELRN